MKKSLYPLQIKALMLCCFLASLVFSLAPRSLTYHIGEKEKLLIETLLQDMIFEQGFAYTLFGNKPVSLAGYFPNPSFDTIFFSKRRTHLPILEAWSALEKNILCHLQGNYALLKQVDLNEKTHHVFKVIIINKSCFLQMVTEHLDLFCELLGEKIHPQELLDEVMLNKRSLLDILKKNEALYGIILGYGKQNSFAFKRRWDLAQVFNPYCQNSQKFSPFYPKASKGFLSSEEEYCYFENAHGFFDIHPSPLSPLEPPYFMIMKNDDKETETLEKIYKKNFKEIVKIYAKGDFLSITLDRLCKKTPFHSPRENTAS